jgi:hypothetical protein
VQALAWPQALAHSAGDGRNCVQLVLQQVQLSRLGAELDGGHQVPYQHIQVRQVQPGDGCTGRTHGSASVSHL